MKPAIRTHTSSRFQQLRLLLLSLLACGVMMSLPSLQAATSHAAQSPRAERQLASEPFVIIANDLLRAIRSDGNGDETDDDPGLQSGSLWLPSEIFLPALSVTPNFIPEVSRLRPLPVVTLPGAPRGPPALPQ